MFRFSILSILCVFVSVASVFAHDPPADMLIVTLRHPESGKETPKRLSDPGVTIEKNENEDGVHVHVYKVEYTADELRTSGVLRMRETFDGGILTETEHQHTFPAHKHGNYVSHTHTGTHSHTSPLDTHSDPHTVDDDHSNVGTRTTPMQNPTETPIPTVGGGGGAPPAVEESGTPEGTSEAGDSGTPVDTSTEQDFLRAQQKYGTVLEGTPETQPERQPLLPIRITEYMVRDWSAGSSGLPQWIEVYNPNTEETVNLKGYTFQYATRRSATAPHKVHTLTLAGTQDGFSIPGDGVAILSTRHLPAWRFSGIEATQVYNLNIDNVLKRGWVLTDADGAEIHRLGREAFSAFGDPVAPLHQNKARVSYQVVPSESPPEVYYYGHREDMGSPGFYEQPAPAAPSAVKRKRVGTWASLKRTP